MSKSYALRQKILLKQGKISKNLYDLRIKQHKTLKATSKLAKQETVRPVDGGRAQ